MSPPSIVIVKKVRTKVKAAKGLKRGQAKVKGVNPSWTAQYTNATTYVHKHTLLPY